MTVENAKNLVQNIHVCLSNAVDEAAQGGDYSDNWERAMQYQTELLRLINDIKYKANNKQRNTHAQQTVAGIER